METVESETLKREIRKKPTDIERHIDVDHVTVRESIAFLVLRLVVLDIIAAVLLILLFGGIYRLNPGQSLIDSMRTWTTLSFVLLGLIKFFLTIAIVTQWLNDYYEIFPNEILHRTGILFRKQEKYFFNHISNIRLNQGVFGRLLNFGSLDLYDWALDKHATMYLIHNPDKYLRILERLMPQTDTARETLRRHFLESRDVAETDENE